MSVNFRKLNLRAGVMLHSLLTLALFVLVLVMWVRGSGGDVEPKAVTDARAAAILRNLHIDITRHNAADRMQQLFPEGACFLYSLYGWAWANLATEPAYREEALPEIRLALRGQTSPAAVDPFRYDTTVRRGAFWLGQRNLLIARYLVLKPDDPDLTTFTEEFHENSADYHDAIMNSPVHQVESYENMCWPADAPAGLASLIIHDDLFGTTYSEALVTWKQYHSTHGWNDTILPPGRIDFETGQHIEPARGCANSLIIALLAPADPAYAAALYKAYHHHFAIARCGFAMFREYPEAATDFKADVDSGPIIMGAGVTATGVGLAAARAVGDSAMERDVRDLSEMFGFPGSIQIDGAKGIRYLRGSLPIGDAFLAWGWSIPRVEEPGITITASPGNRAIFHTIVIATLVLLGVQWVLHLKSARKRLRKLK